MGFRFKKSVKIAPVVKLNLGKKSASVTLGGKGIHHTVSSTGRTTTTVGVPGTGVSYSKTSTSKKGTGRRKNTKNNTMERTTRQHVNETYVTKEVLDENTVSTCPNCGATVRGSVCSYCNTPLDVGTKTIRTKNVETFDIPQVPNQEEYSNSGNQTNSFRRKHPALFWFLMICFWPFSLGYWFYKTDKIPMDKIMKIAVLVVVYVFLYTTGAKENPDSLTPMIGILGFLGLLVFIGLTIWNKLKRKSLRNSIIGIIACFLTFMVCIVNSPVSSPVDNEEETKIEEKVEERVEEKAEAAKTNEEEPKHINMLMGCKIKTSDVYKEDETKEVIGKRAYIILSEEEFNKLEDNDISEFSLKTVKKYEDEEYDFFTVDFKNGKGLVFPACTCDPIEYGQINKDGTMYLIEKYIYVSEEGAVEWYTRSQDEIDQELEEKKRIEEEAKEKAEEVRIKAEEEAKAKAEEEKAKAEEEARLKAEQEAAEREERLNSRTVYVSVNGLQHSKSTCSGMKYYTEMTYGEAKAYGYTPCQKCSYSY